MGSGQGKQGPGREREGRADRSCCCLKTQRTGWLFVENPCMDALLVTVQGSLQVAEALLGVRVMEPVTCRSSTGDLGTSNGASKAS